MRWDPELYGRFAAERGRAFADLLARVEVDRPDLVLDLGCGPGLLTADLASRWPTARVLGVDSSPEMIAAACGRPEAPDRLSFELADLREWQPPGPVDVLVANAVLQWVPDHLAGLGRLAGWLAPGGVLALQVPGNHGAPAHQLLRALAGEPAWADRLGAVLARPAPPTPADYLDRLTGLGLAADVWETTYLHVLRGADPVLDWMRGTGLRPALAGLSPAGQRELEHEYGRRLRIAYPAGRDGTVLAFRRVFAVGRRAT